MASVSSESCSNTVSVISSSRRCGSSPAAAMALTTDCSRPGLRNCAGDRLTATCSGFGQDAASNPGRSGRVAVLGQIHLALYRLVDRPLPWRRSRVKAVVDLRQTR